MNRDEQLKINYTEQSEGFRLEADLSAAQALPLALIGSLIALAVCFFVYSYVEQHGIDIVFIVSMFAGLSGLVTWWWYTLLKMVGVFFIELNPPRLRYGVRIGRLSHAKQADLKLIRAVRKDQGTSGDGFAYDTIAFERPSLFKSFSPHRQIVSYAQLLRKEQRVRIATILNSWIDAPHNPALKPTE